MDHLPIEFHNHGRLNHRVMVMKEDEIRRLIDAFEKKSIEKEELIHLLTSGGFSDLEHSKVDTSRFYRIGFPEVVLCNNKTGDEIIQISRELFKKNGFVLLTKANKDQYERLKIDFEDSKFNERAGIIILGKGMEKRGYISVLSGGTSDLPVAEEAAITAEVFGCNSNRIYDVGIAGLHRLLAYRERIEESNVIIAVAGMEGALPSVVSGLFGIPVIGVPTSIGYGASFKGIAPLLTMLNSCAPGVGVVNIDNGFGAGFLAALINRRIEDTKRNG